MIVDGCKETSHIEGEVCHSEIIGYGVDGSHVNAFLSGVGSHVDPDLFQQVENLSATKICGRGPFLGSGATEENLREKVIMYTIPAETLPPLMLWELYSQVGVPDSLPYFERVESGSKQLLGLFIDSSWWSSSAIRGCTSAAGGAWTKELSLGVVDLDMNGVYKY